ncbi:MAG: hypothetical protein AAF587_38340 [Bacteroidota bacterium]
MNPTLLLGLLACLLTANSFGQESFYTLLDSSHQESYQTLQQEHIYEISHQELHRLFQQSDKQYKLIYTFGVWCKPCIELLPTVLNLSDEHADKLDLYTVITENRTNILQLSRNYFARYKDFDRPVFNVSNVYHKRWRKKYNIFIDKLVPGHENFGMSLLILFDENNQVVFVSNYYLSKEDKINKVLEFLEAEPVAIDK